MLASLPAGNFAARRHVIPAWAVALPLFLCCALFMFVDARIPPIYLWDESRLAVNALEMHQRGWSLVTTYGFVPDLWNTKPPLLIWLMNASIGLFGPSELALRLPSMAAAMATLGVVFLFVRRVTHSLGAAAFAVFLLSTSVAFFGRHGARAGDFDALLCFFTTSYLCLLFFAVHRRRPSRWILIAIGALVAGAALTKTVAALVPGVGVAVYLLLTGRVVRAVGTPRYALMVLASLVPLTLFYLARELAAPGYLHAVWYNDFVGRYQDQLGPIRRSRWFFFQELGYDWMFSAGPLALLSPLGLLGRKTPARQALLYALCCVLSQLVLISLPATRLIQYMLPALPWMAIGCAIAMADRLPRYFARATATPQPFYLNPATALIVVTIIFSSVTAARLRYELVPKQDFYPQASYGALFAALHDRGTNRIRVVEPGMNVSGLTAYAPQLDFYTLLWRARGMDVKRVERLTRVSELDVVATCDPASAARLVAQGAQAVGLDGCVAQLPTALTAR